MRLPAGGRDNLGNGRALWSLQHRDQHRLLRSCARCRLVGCGRFGRMIKNGGHCLYDHRLEPDGQQAGVGDHQRGPMTVAGLTSERFAAPQVGVDFLQPAVLDHLGDDHLRRRTGQTLGLRQDDVVDALSPNTEDDGLSFGEFSPRRL